MTQSAVTLSGHSNRAAPILTAPTQAVSGWDVVRKLGEGQLAEVYLARPLASTVDAPAGYALKVLRPAWQYDLRVLEMFCQEARVGRRICHPNVVPILDAGLHQAPYFVVMPRLEGATLAQRLARGEQLSLPTALWIARQVAQGLAALDGDGWMHNDVKPSNIFVASTAHATLIDLGFAQRIEELTGLSERPVLGTTRYMAPEMLSASLVPDIRSDIYSLGVTLFEMLTGRFPYGAEDVAELARQHRQMACAVLRKHAPHVPSRVARLVHQMLSKDPTRRPQNPSEVVERLVALEIEAFAQR